MPICLLSSIMISVLRTSLSSYVTWRSLRFSDWRHGRHGSSLTVQIFFIWDSKLVFKITALSMIKVCQEPTNHHQWLGGYWGLLTGHIEDIGHHWSDNCSWDCIPNICSEFQHSSMVICLSRTPCPYRGYLEDIEGSWPEPGGQSFLTS